MSSYAELSDSQLLSVLDDVVQNLCGKSNFDWLTMEKKDFNRIKLELMCRLSERNEKAPCKLGESNGAISNKYESEVIISNESK